MVEGTLYICATPIGNLKDITVRALEILKGCDLIACEDTRHVIKLLNHYGIKNRLISYHAHNERIRCDEIIGLLKDGRSIALVSDAGMPGISDPGSVIINACYKEGLRVSICPGASAFVSALALAGLADAPFIFEGFLPAKKKERIHKLTELSKASRNVVLYESPHKLRRTLTDILEYMGDRDVAVVREITKIHEETVHLTVSGAIDKYDNPKGEFVLIIKGCVVSGKCPADDELIEDELIEMVDSFVADGLSDMEAIKQTAKKMGLPKSAVYKIRKKINYS
jgi:16S rRNA (cytidine1402-2'-O)-methyltransferase